MNLLLTSSVKDYTTLYAKFSSSMNDAYYTKSKIYENKAEVDIPKLNRINI